MFLRSFFVSISVLVLSLLSFGQVSLQTGSAVFDYPIYTFQDNKSRLSFPVSFGYNSGYGLRVDEVATDVGQGWGMIAGGRIVRQQIGEPDDQVELTGDVNNTTKYPAGYLYTTENAQNGVPVNYNKYPVYNTQNKFYKPHNKFVADRELDYFNLTLNGVNATFVLRKGTNDGEFIGNSLMKIRFETSGGSFQYLDAATGLGTQKARTIITKFILTDENAIEYTFEKKAYSRILKTIPTDRSFDKAIQAPKKINKHFVYYEAQVADNASVNPYIVTEWHLTSISDKLVTGRTISLNYTYRSMDMWMGVEAQFIAASKNHAKLIARRSIVRVPALTSVVCPNNYTFTFAYNPQQRHDLPGSFALNSISVQYNNRFIQKHTLQQSYAMLTRFGIPSNDIEKFSSRLYLLGITKLTADLADSERPIQFDYYMGGSNTADIIPPPFHIAKDVWGYYNGFRSIVGNDSQLPSATQKQNSLILGRMVSAAWYTANGGYPAINYDLVKRITFHEFNPTAIKTNYARNGLLKGIHYPTGGSMVYEYSQNRATYYNEATSETEVGGVNVSKTIVYDGGYSNNCASGGISTRYDYKAESGLSSMWGVERPVNSFASTVAYKPFVKKWKFPIACNYVYKYPGITQIEYASHISGYQKFMSSDAGKAINLVSNIYSIYTTIQTGLMLASAGAPVIAIVSAVVQVIYMIFDFVWSCTIQDDWRDYTNTVKYNNNLRGVNPLPMLFRRVEVIENNGSNGKTVHEFTSDNDYPIWFPSNPLFNRRQRFAPWAYGLPKKVTVLHQSGRKVSEKENFYHLPFSCMSEARSTSTMTCYPMQSNTGLFNCSVITTKSKAERFDHWSSAGFIAASGTGDYTTTDIDGLSVEVYQLYTGRTFIDSTVERVYDNSDATKILKKKTRYEFSNTNFLPTFVEEISTGRPSVITKTTYIGYPDNNNTTPHGLAAARLYNAGIIITPTLVEKFVRRADLPENDPYDYILNGYQIVSLEEPLFITVASGLVKTESIRVKRTNVPMSNLSTVPFVTVQEFNYDADGLLIGSRDEGNRYVSQLYDYDKQFVVATGININSQLFTTERFAYSSFETTSGTGGWDLSKAATSGTSITGGKYFALSGGSISTSGSSFPTQHPMKLSLWASTSAVTITGISSGATPVKTGPTRRGFTYYEYDVQPNGGKITITGSANIDEVRLYPAKGRMVTNSYDPLLGKTSECDQNNRVTYFEYDTKGRLRIVKDDQGHIVKMYEYNDKQKMEKCPAVFYNSPVYHMVQRTNCTGDFIGGFVEYVVPAARYSSSFSQEHADLLANIDAWTSGSTYANANAPCVPVYYNTARSVSFTKEGCDETYGYVGSVVTYTVPQRVYFSLISLEDANDQRDTEIDANGQKYANDNGTCLQTTVAQWEGIESTMRCKTVGGNTTGETEMQFKDMNPSSSTYNQLRWEVLPTNPLGCVVSNPPCPEEHWQYINGVCEQGTLYMTVNDGYDSTMGMWRCLQYYSYSNGFVYVRTVYGPIPCPDQVW
jgi:hypothetical protein